eukprot:TRINITY_DN18138_c0_g1_i1.p1 TRINITY_DN18138_c0_g1~~TRINITY_DN18138_c0_g1_i1.p1  ORF type:complete len:260 (+),score=45.74 TRINITY_DN18138_c0_g1_i1:46-825(+)
MEDNIDTLLLQVSEDRRRQVEDSERSLLMDVLPRLVKMEEDVAVMRNDVKNKLSTQPEGSHLEKELAVVHDRISQSDNNIRMICEEVVGIAELLKERTYLNKAASEITSPPPSVIDSQLANLMDRNDVGPYALPEKPVVSIGTQTSKQCIDEGVNPEPSLVYSRIEKDVMSIQTPPSILQTPPPVKYVPVGGSTYSGYQNNNLVSVGSPPVRSPRPSPTYIGRSIPTSGYPQQQQQHQQFSVKIAFQGSPVPVQPHQFY